MEEKCSCDCDRCGSIECKCGQCSDNVCGMCTVCEVKCQCKTRKHYTDDNK